MLIQDIQNEWARALDHESRLGVAQKILGCMSEGYFNRHGNSLKPSWKYVLEAELMKDMNLAYIYLMSWALRETDVLQSRHQDQRVTY